MSVQIVGSSASSSTEKNNMSVQIVGSSASSSAGVAHARTTVIALARETGCLTVRQKKIVGTALVIKGCVAAILAIPLAMAYDAVGFAPLGGIAVALAGAWIWYKSSHTPKPADLFFEMFPSQLAEIITSYHDVTDPRIASSILNRLSKALVLASTDQAPTFTVEISRIQGVLKTDQERRTKATQLTVRDTMLEIFDRVRSDVAQLSIQEVREALPRLPQIQRGMIENWLPFGFFDGLIEADQKTEADQKEQRASESVALAAPGQIFEPELYVAFRHLLTDAKIQNSFDANLVQFAIRVDERFRFETNLQTALAHQSIAAQAEAVRAWFKFHQSQREWRAIKNLSLENFPQSTSFDILRNGGYSSGRAISGPAISMKLSWEIVTLLKSMPNLFQVHLNNNELIALPEAIGELSQLEDLGLNANRLKVLPRTIGKLIKLESLRLGFNQLQSLPATLGNLTKLEQLDLHSNQLQVLPESIGLCKQLRWVHLASNPLRSVPQTLGNLKKFKHLLLSSDQQGELSDTIRRLCPSCEISVPAPGRRGTWEALANIH